MGNPLTYEVTIWYDAWKEELHVKGANPIVYFELVNELQKVVPGIIFIKHPNTEMIKILDMQLNITSPREFSHTMMTVTENFLKEKYPEIKICFF